METIGTARSQLASGAITSCKLTEESIARAMDATGEGKLVFTKVFTAQAKLVAEAIDKMATAGVGLSAIAGLPISVKDLFDVRGEVTTAGSAVLRQAAPAKKDAEVIGRLKRAGAVIVGKTNMTEFAYSGVGINPHFGTAANPFDRKARLIAGGSSSGAAVSVTDGMALAAIGSDTGGSCRIPAALCGLTGFKPTQRRIPLDGVFPLSSSLDSVGTIAWTVKCCAIVDGILAADPIDGLQPAELRALTFTVPQNYMFESVDSHVAKAFERALGKLSSAGAKIVEKRFPEFEEIAALNSKGGLSAAESYAFHRRLGTDFKGYDPLVLERILAGQNVTAADYLDLREARASMLTRFRHAHASSEWILCPTVPIVAPPIERLRDPDEFRRVNRLLLRNPSIANFLDGCSLSLPCHTAGAAPVGLMLIGRTGADRALLSAGLAVESALAFKRPPQY
jgi:aspartyl-tRNA(Asn)/glutamyl-tRNA(Gln) amidotransferase subunit A